MNNINKYFNLLEKNIDNYSGKTIVIFEMGHFSFTSNVKDLEWSKNNIEFVDKLCGRIINKYDKKIKIIPTILINNLGNEININENIIIDEFLKTTKYINKKSLKIIYQKTLKNHSFNLLKNNMNLKKILININGKIFLEDKTKDYPVGILNEKGKIIPKCGLILNNYFKYIEKFSKERLNKDKKFNTLVISFSKEYEEYKKFVLAYNIYLNINKKIDFINFHWKNNREKDLYYLNIKGIIDKDFKI